MGSGGVAIAALPTVICLKVPFSDGLGGYNHLHAIAQGIATLYPGLCSFAPTARNHRSSLHYLAHCAVRVFHDIDAFAYSLALCSANGIYCYRNNIANADSLN